VHPSELAPCDLVMKGGVTSGVVYPGAVLELSRTYRFTKIGGTSAGAVAASMAAAAEYGRQRAERLELRGIDEIVEEFKQPGFMLDLFQPTPTARPLFRLGMALASAKQQHRRRWRILALAGLRQRPLFGAIATLVAAGIIALLAVGFDRLPVVLAIVLAVLGSIALMLLASWAVLGPLMSMLRSIWRSLPDQGFGICSGTSQDPNRPLALAEWMHSRIQVCAELGVEQPLTFGMLQDAGIELQMIATDLGRARPVRIPFEEEQFLFTPRELGRLFPAPVVDHVLDAAGVPSAERDSTRAWFMPAQEMPVVIGARLSSSVPLMLSALRLYSARPDLPGPIESFISDGAITSNFPIHFFDDWLPSHPTFGLDLVPFPQGGHPGDADPVFMPASAEVPRVPHWTNVSNLGGFLRQIDDAARNWRDELQAELPGFRDRVCQIRMGAGEGGFNLNADPKTVSGLLERGRAAGREILRTFDWDQHRFVRYVTLMEMLQENFSLLADRFGDYRSWLTSGAPDATAYRIGRDAEWCLAADRATAQLIENAPDSPSFASGERPQPEPAMRIGPRV
jgi:patatin-like phospholipase